MLTFNFLTSLRKLNMPTCATPKKTTDIPWPGNLILPVPDTDFRDYLDEVDELVGFAPEIVAEIEKDLDAHARDGFEFGEVGRRGIDAVRAELTEKLLAYNCCRIILMKQRREKRRREEMKRAA
jgi:hypothetical protein